MAALSYESIWKGFADAFGVTFSPEVIERHTPQSTTTLCECGHCRLQYFTPSLPGDTSFYRQLMAQVPYPGARWEFDVVVKRLSGAISVIDLGCGRGAFLRAVHAELPEARVVGVDHHADAIAQVRAAGIEAHVADVTDMVERESEPFDVVCVFQTLEHVSDPLGLVSAASRLLAPDGRLFLSVPNRERTVKGACEPLDCPPHHVTRWTADQFAYIATRLGMVVRSVTFEPPVRWDVREPQRRRAEQSLTRLGQPAARAIRRIDNKLQTPNWLYSVKASRGTYARQGLFGHGVLVELRRTRAT